MGIYQRPDSCFWWMLIERPGQKPLRLSTGFPIEGGSLAQTKELRRTAQEAYSTKMVDIGRRRYKLPGSLERRSFKDHREWYATHLSAHKRGHVRERSMLRQLGAFFDAYDLTAIDRTLALEWRTWRRQTVSANTVNREEEILKHMLTQAVPTYLDENPLKGLSRLRIVDVETRILTPEEERDLLTAAKPDPSATAVLLCGLDALMRKGSIAHLKRAQDHGGYLTLLNAKAGTYKVPISSRLRKALDAVPTDGERYFERYHPGYENKIQRLFEALCTAANVTRGHEDGGVTFHSLRHTGASRMLAAGVDIKTVMLIGGWRNLKVLERYLHPTAQQQRAAVNTIATKAKGRRR